MSSTDVQRKKHFLYPALLFAEPEAHSITTVLGSCVSVCLYDTRLLLGGINHYMLPEALGEEVPSARFGNVSMTMLLEQMLSLGADKKNLVAKVFGGAVQFAYPDGTSVGQKNVEAAVSFLAKAHIPLVSASTGGTLGRKIIFHSDTGMVQMKFLRSVIPTTTGST